MTSLLKAALLAALLIPFAGGANAAPVSPGSTDTRVAESVTLVHGTHRSCRRGEAGWHRHERIRRRGPDRWVRRRCHPWHGRGRRPDHCVRVGPVLICEN
jgi:hypothetical protein